LLELTCLAQSYMIDVQAKIMMIDNFGNIVITLILS
jgi:hypothetical protein